MSSTRQASVTLLAVLYFSGSLSGCISAPPKKPNLGEQVKKENAQGSELAEDLEVQLHLRTDPAIDAYLKKVTRRLVKMSGDPRLADTEVAMVQDQGPTWRSFGLPGKRVYLSVGWLKKVQTDSELAAMIALELGRIQQRQVLNHVDGIWPAEDVKAASPVPSVSPTPTPVPSGQKKKPEFFGEKGLFTYNQKETEAAIGAAVAILYKGGFDSRGLVSYFEMEKANLQHSTQSETALYALIDMARDGVDNYPPLINPIVRTREFATLRKRIQKL
jgi:predicted Zn-dependent protease